MYCLASISATAPLIALSARSRSLGGGGASSAGGGRPAASFFGAALARARAPLINLAGVSLMLKEANQFGETLSATDVAILFTRSNAPTEVAEGGGALTYSLDSSLVLDNDAELSAPEFVQFVGRVADVRVPADRRGATPFEETLDAWLGLQLVPACRKAVQARGGRWHTEA